MKMIPVLAALVLLGSSAFAEGARDESTVTFKGSVLMQDGMVDPAQVRLVLKQRNAENEVSPEQHTHTQTESESHSTSQSVYLSLSQASDGQA